jgi:transposase
MPWSRGKAYSQDLRERVFALTDDGYAVGQVAAQLLVSVSYVSKVLSRRRLTGEVSARPQRCHVPLRLLNLHDAIAARVLATPDATLDELRQWLADEHMTRASQGPMSKTLAQLRLTHKKKSIHAAEQARPDVAAAREAWRQNQPELNAGKLIFLDETWTTTNMVRRYGRAICGQRLVDAVPHGHWQISTFIGGLRQSGSETRGSYNAIHCFARARGPPLANADHGKCRSISIAAWSTRAMVTRPAPSSTCTIKQCDRTRKIRYGAFNSLARFGSALIRFAASRTSSR